MKATEIQEAIAREIVLKTITATDIDSIAKSLRPVVLKGLEERARGFFLDIDFYDLMYRNREVGKQFDKDIMSILANAMSKAAQTKK